MFDASRIFFRKARPLFFRRLAMSFFGVVVCSFSIGFFKLAQFGTDPYQCLCTGISNKVPIGYGNVQALMNLLLLAVVFFFGRKYIGFATFFAVFLTGYIVEFSVWLLGLTGIPMTLFVRVAFLAVGIVLMCLAASFYMTAALGVSTYDAQAMMLADRRLGPFRFVRIFTDLVCVGSGFLMGATVGVGTLITALFMGPLIDLFTARFARPFLLRGRG
jgi:uncharacterized membrane protein YczE